MQRILVDSGFPKLNGILSIIKNCFLQESNDIEAKQAALSMLALKLIGWERLSQINSFDSESFYFMKQKRRLIFRSTAFLIV